MKSFVRALALFAILALTIAPGTAEAAKVKLPLNKRIKHIVVLMEENRSFDHMFGWRKGVNGLNGTQYNLVNASDPHSQRVYVTHNATQINPCNPNHNFGATTYKIFGPDAYAHKNYTSPTMSGFVNYEHAGKEHCGVMEMFQPARVPILNALADDFVLFDRFFASLPGPTWPNRVFYLSGTSGGLTETGHWYHNVPGALFPCKTIMDQVAERGGSWRLYFNDTPWELLLETTANHPENTLPLSEFFEDARKGTLPSFSLVNPRAAIDVGRGLGSNDQHPDHDVALGEAFYKDIYEALRAGPEWNSTLLVITYDEHGGFYDHVPTPLHIPPPDNEKSYPDKFAFDRLGLRIPTLLISPWLPKGHVESAPPATQKPAPNSEYELTSIMASARKLLEVIDGVGPLTRRDAWAATFEHLFTLLDEPRTDCPMHLPDALPPTKSLHEEAMDPINGRQQNIIRMHAHLAGVDFPKHIQHQKDVTHWVQKHYKIHHERTMAWKASKASPMFEIYLGPTGNDHTGNLNMFRVTTMSGPTAGVAATDNRMTISFHVANVSFPLCWDSGAGTPGTRLTVTRCHPSEDPHTNRDPSQQWLFGEDAMIRPYHNQNLCVDTDAIRDESKDSVFLAVCDEKSVTQHYAYSGEAPGEGFGGNIYIGAMYCKFRPPA